MIHHWILTKEAKRVGTGEYPFVSLIMPIRNEANYIARSLGAVLAQDYPSDCMEVVIVDGMSNDGTRETIQRMIESLQDLTDKDLSPESIRPSSLILLNNPSRITATALNSALREARGEIITIVGGHCEISADYVRRCVEVLWETGADCVGGPMITVGETWSAQAIAFAQRSVFGVGNVAFRTGCRTSGYVDTVAFGAYRREVFEQIGGFDEELVRNQDDEFNYRLIRSGGKIWLAPSIRSIYYSRTSLKGLWQQYLQYGFYKVRVIQKLGGVPSWRHLVPPLFVLTLTLAVFLSLVMWQPVFALALVGPYLVSNLTASLWTAKRRLGILPMLPPAFVILHMSYGTGFLWGLSHWLKRDCAKAISN